MKQAKSFITENEMNKCLKNYLGKEIVDIKFNNALWGVIYE